MTAVVDIYLMLAKLHSGIPGELRSRQTGNASRIQIEMTSGILGRSQAATVSSRILRLKHAVRGTRDGAAEFVIPLIFKSIRRNKRHRSRYILGTRCGLDSRFRAIEREVCIAVVTTPEAVERSKTDADNLTILYTQLAQVKTHSRPWLVQYRLMPIIIIRRVRPPLVTIHIGGYEITLTARRFNQVVILIQYLQQESGRVISVSVRILKHHGILHQQYGVGAVHCIFIGDGLCAIVILPVSKTNGCVSALRNQRKRVSGTRIGSRLIPVHRMTGQNRLGTVIHYADIVICVVARGGVFCAVPHIRISVGTGHGRGIQVREVHAVTLRAEHHQFRTVHPGTRIRRTDTADTNLQVTLIQIGDIGRNLGIIGRINHKTRLRYPGRGAYHTIVHLISLRITGPFYQRGIAADHRSRHIRRTTAAGVGNHDIIHTGTDRASGLVTIFVLPCEYQTGRRHAIRRERIGRIRP